MSVFAKDSLEWNRQIIKWLLAVVCIIALGNSALDFGKKALKDIAPNIVANAGAEINENDED